MSTQTFVGIPASIIRFTTSDSDGWFTLWWPVVIFFLLIFSIRRTIRALLIAVDYRHRIKLILRWASSCWRFFMDCWDEYPVLLKKIPLHLWEDWRRGDVECRHERVLTFSLEQRVFITFDRELFPANVGGEQFYPYWLDALYVLCSFPVDYRHETELQNCCFSRSKRV